MKTEERIERMTLKAAGLIEDACIQISSAESKALWELEDCEEAAELHESLRRIMEHLTCAFYQCREIESTFYYDRLEKEAANNG